MGAVLQQVWQKEVENNLYPSFDKLKMICKDDSVYLNGTTVNIPNAGAAGTIEKNPSYPLTVEERTDTTVSYNIDKFAFRPTRVDSLTKVQSSYDMMKSVLEDVTMGVPQRALKELVINWYTDGTYKVNTTGSNYTGHAPGATGNRKGLTSADVVLAKKAIVKHGYESDLGLVVDYDMFYQLADSLGVQANRDFSYVYDAVSGEMQKIHGVSIVVVPSVCYVASNDAIRAYGNAGATSDNAVALLVHKSAVSLAIGGIELFLDERNPIYQADLISGGLLAGGKYRRTDKKGVVPIIQAT